MREALTAIYLELLRRYESGERSIFLSDEAMTYLRGEANQAGQVRDAIVPDARNQVKQDLPAGPMSETVVVKTREVVEVPPPPDLVLTAGSDEAKLEALRGAALADPWSRSQVRAGKQIIFG